jgi:hypothetical protein
VWLNQLHKGVLWRWGLPKGGPRNHVPVDEVEVDTDDYGGGAADLAALGLLLEDCLSIRA